MKARIAFTSVVGLFMSWGFVLAQMQSTNFLIRWDSLSAGSDTSASASYQLRDSINEAEAGTSASVTYQLQSGYRAGIFDQVIAFNVLPENRAQGRAATALAGTVITTSPTGIAVGNFVALVQDEGANQVSAVGRVTAVGGTTITVDTLTNGGTAPVIDGASDMVYPLTGTSLAFANLDQNAVRTQVVGFNVDADLDNGYVVQLREDAALTFSGNTIDDVTDGAVTVGFEEYGARSSDTSLAGTTFDTQDTAITSTFQDITTIGDNAFDSRSFLTLKVAIRPNTVGGDYTHTLTFIISGNY